jgi:D-alanyl-D-alanine carboxypeptidase/D-alanyl-D-alanine-endopeptidase (penicillin-binding protein 4)
LKTVALRTRGRPASTAAGAEVATAWLRDLGAFEPSIRIGNGSGLFDANRLTARALARLLVSVKRNPDLAEPFASHLAVGGVDGTLRGRFHKLAQRRAVLAKTGTLRDVVALSGYVIDPERARPIAFALILNGVAGRTAPGRQRIDRVVELVAKELAGNTPVGGSLPEAGAAKARAQGG